jgi:hypothetical protein
MTSKACRRCQLLDVRSVGISRLGFTNPVLLPVKRPTRSLDSRAARGFSTRTQRRLYVKVVRIHLSVSDLMNMRILSVLREDLRVLNH